MHAELANLNPCAVPFLSRAAIKLSWYDSNTIDAVRYSGRNSRYVNLCIHFNFSLSFTRCPCFWVKEKVTNTDLKSNIPNIRVSRMVALDKLGKPGEDDMYMA